MNIIVPVGVREVIDRLREAGFQAWCVGGCVRDTLLGSGVKDWDLATDARPEEVRRIFARTIPVGLEHGTVGVLDSSGVLHEVTTFRRDMETDGRHAVVQFSKSIEEDLARRDFTINAMAYDPISGTLCDPYGGRADLTLGRVRCVGVAEERMREDRLRALRAIRFAGRYGFSINDETWAAVCLTPLGELSAERVWGELWKTLGDTRGAGESISLWRRCGATATWLPEERDSEVGRKLLDSSLGPVERMAGLFWGATMGEINAACRRIKAPNEVRESLSHFHQMWQRIEPLKSDVASLRRAASVITRARLEFYCRLRNIVSGPDGLLEAGKAAIALGDLEVSGDDLIALGLKGKEIGDMLQKLLDRVLERPEDNNRKKLLDFAARPLENRRR